MNNTSATPHQSTTTTALEQKRDIPPSLVLNPDKYREHLDEFDLTEEQQNELLVTLWNIMRTFVEIGFGLDSVQLFAAGATEKTRSSGDAALEKTHHLPQFNRTALPRKKQEDRNE